MFLSKRSNGIYYVFYVNSDRKKTCISTKTKKKSEAWIFLSNFRNELKERKLNKTIPTNLKDFVFEFLKYSESVHTPKTTTTFKTTFNFFLSYFGDIPLIDLTHKSINEYLQYRINSSSLYSARKDLINISSSLTKAVNDNYLLENPCKKIKRIKTPEKQPLFFSETDFEILLRNIDNKMMKALSILAVNTGLRQGELLSLEWNQINFLGNYIILDNRNHLSKSKKIRTIPLNLVSLQILTELERHTFASWLVQKGVSIFEVSKLLGHSDIRVTEIYSHLRAEDLLNSVNKLNN